VEGLKSPRLKNKKNNKKEDKKKKKDEESISFAKNLGETDQRNAGKGGKIKE